MPKYNNTILNYYNDDSHTGSFDEKDKSIGTGLVGSPSCGDVMKLQIKVIKKKDKKIISDAKILVFGCGSAKASSSYVAQQLIGKTLEEAMQIKNSDIANYLGLPKIKLHCSVLAEEAIKQAIEDYNGKHSAKSRNTHNKKNDKKTVQTQINNLRHDNLSRKDTFNIKKFSISITKEATDFVENTLKKLGKKNIKGIRLSLEEGHCGLMYKVRYVDNQKMIANDMCYKINDLNIYVPKEQADILNGTKIEYKEENLKRGLIFKNPRETNRCSCGKNFLINTTNKKI